MLKKGWQATNPATPKINNITKGGVGHYPRPLPQPWKFQNKMGGIGHDPSPFAAPMEPPQPTSNNKHAWASPWGADPTQNQQHRNGGATI